MFGIGVPELVMAAPIVIVGGIGYAVFKALSGKGNKPAASTLCPYCGKYYAGRPAHCPHCGHETDK